MSISVNNYPKSNLGEQLQKPEIDFGVLVQDTLSSAELASLPADQQGRVVVDRFIGATVRQGDIVSSNGTKLSPSHVLKMIDSASNNAAGHEDWQRGVTRANGLRDAVATLASDRRTSQLLGQLSGRLRHVLGRDEQVSKPAMSSMAMLEGYLFATTKRPTPAYVGVLIDRAMQMTEDSRVEWLGEQTDLDRSENQNIRKIGQEWNEATFQASQDGVDLGLLERSANLIRSEAATERMVGALSVGQVAAKIGYVMPETEFDHLFE